MMNNKLDSLIALLDDPDNSVFEIVLEEILKENIAVVDQLEQIWEISMDDLVQKRIEFIIQKIQLNDTKDKIKDWSNKKSLDLFEGMFLISRYHYPELKLKPVKTQLENIRKDIWLEFRNSLSSLEKITILNHIFFDHYQFRVDHKNPGLPQQCYINRILDSRKGNQVSITILYALVARSLNLPVYYIDFQSNPLVGFFESEISDSEKENQVLFYINPSNKGAIIGPKEIDYILHTSNPEEQNKLIQACPDRVVIKRLLETLINDYTNTGATGTAIYLSEIADLL